MSGIIIGLLRLEYFSLVQKIDSVREKAYWNSLDIVTTL